jgi:hypothetical protein
LIERVSFAAPDFAVVSSLFFPFDMVVLLVRAGALCASRVEGNDSIDGVPKALKRILETTSLL